MKKQYAGNGWYKAVLIVMIIAALAIVGIGVLTVFFPSFFNQEAPTQETVLTGTILNLIGLAITTWVGLNIVDRMDRATIQRLQEQAKELEGRFAISGELERKRLVDDLKADRQFAIAQWILKKVKLLGENSLNVDIWRTIREEEDYYHRLEKSQTKEEAHDIFRHTQNCIKDVRNLLKSANKKERQIINQILTLREVEINFVLAYRMEKPEDQKKAFLTAINYYSGEGRKGSLPWREVPSDKLLDSRKTECQEILDSISKEDCAIMAYIFNILGESYSKIVEYGNNGNETKRVLNRRAADKKAEEAKTQAFNYCLLAVKTSEKGQCERETYYRNLGCAIERVNYKSMNERTRNKVSIKEYVKHLEQAISWYTKALQLSTNNRQALHCLASAYNKIFETLVKSEHYSDQCCAEAQEPKIQAQLQAYMRQFRQAKDLYLGCFPSLVEAHIMAALYQRNMYILYREDKSIAATIAVKLERENSILGLLAPTTQDTKVGKDSKKILEDVEESKIAYTGSRMITGQYTFKASEAKR